MARSEANTRLLLAALGLSPDELDDALVWARGRAGELLDSLEDTELRAMLEREPVASPHRSTTPTPTTSPPQAPAPVIASWNLPRAPWQPSRFKKPVAPTSAPPDGPTVLEDEAAAEQEDGAPDEPMVPGNEAAAEQADGAPDEQTSLANDSATDDAVLADDDAVLADDDAVLSDDDVMLADEPDETVDPWRGEAILADGPPLPPQEPPRARPHASARVVPAASVPPRAAARAEDERDPDAPTTRTDHSRRRATRYSLSTPVVVRVDQVSGLHELSTRDISRHGIFIESNSPPEPNARISVQLPFPDGSGVVNLVGEVVRVVTTRQAAASGKAPGFGVTFSPVSDENRRELERLLEHAKSSAAADVPRPRGARTTPWQPMQGVRAPRGEPMQPARGASKISKG